jgi:hypothetical protein
MSRCGKCRESLPPEAFHTDRSRPDGLAYWCKGCRRVVNRLSAQKRPHAQWSSGRRASERVRQKLYRKQHPERAKARDIRSAHDRRFKRHGLDEARFEAQLDAQQGRCPLCCELLSRTPQLANTACIDHDHETGKVRGILCAQCNKGLGCFRDSAQVVRRAAQYLTKWQK